MAGLIKRQICSSQHYENALKYLTEIRDFLIRPSLWQLVKRALAIGAIGMCSVTASAQVFELAGGPYAFGETSFSFNVTNPTVVDNLDLYLALQTKPFGALEDLEVTLKSPAGTIVRLVASGALGDLQGFLRGDRFQGTRFTAEAPIQIEGGTPPYTGDYKVDGHSAANSMALFAGQQSAGLWVLTVRDPVGLGGTVYGTANMADAPWPSAATRLVITLVPAPSMPDLTPESDSGSSNTDNITNVRTPTVSGTAKPNHTITIYAGNSAAGTTTSNSQGVWTATVSSPLSGGAHTITATAADAFGNQSNPSKPLVMSVDLNVPTISSISNQIIPENGSGVSTFVIGDVETAISDLKLMVSSSNPGLTPQAGLVLGGSGANRRLDITPAAEMSGQAQITVTVTDVAGNIGTRNFLLDVQSVNGRPVLAPINNVTIAEGSEFRFSASASDREGGPLTFSLDAGAAVGATINAATGQFSWTPSEVQGPSNYSLTVRVSDNGSPSLSAMQTFTVTVNEVNAAPVLAAIAAQTVNEGSVLTVTPAATDTDLPANALSFSLGSGAPVGAAINPTTGVFTWTPLESQGPGTFNITVQVSDNAVPAALTDSKTFTVTVSEINQAPSLSSIGSQSVTEGNRLTLTASASDPDLPANTLTYSLINAAPADAAINSTTGVFTWTPAEAQGPGSFTISVQAADNGSPALAAVISFTVTVNEANAAPALSPISNQTVRAGETLIVPVSASDPDFPANVLTFSLEPGAPAGALINSASGIIQWTTPSSVQPATNVFRVRVTDNGTPSASDTKTFIVVVNASNQAPQIPVLASQNVDEGKTLNLTIAATDPDQPPNRLAYALGPNAPAGLSIDPLSGVLTWTPSEAQGPSTNSITVRVTDDALPPLSGERTVVVTVNEINAAPVMAPISNQSILAGSLLSFPVSVTDPDLPTNTISFRLAAGAPAGASVHPTTGVFTWTPTLAQGATTNVIGIVATDNGAPSLSDTKNFTVVVISPNTAPVLDPVPDQTIDEGSALTVTLRARDADQPPDQLTYSLRSGAPAGVSVNPNTGVLTWTPSEAQGPSTNRVGVRVADNGIPPLSHEQEIVIIVREVNAPPIIGPTPDQTVKEGELLTLTVSASDPDVPANAVQFSLSGIVPAGFAIDPASGVITWRPSEAQGPSTNRITIVATDNGTPSQSTNRVLTVIVTEDNVPPILQPIAARTINEGTAVTFTAVATDPDQPAQKLTFSLGPGTPAGVSIDPATGTVSWVTTEADGPSTNSIRVRVTDDGVPPQSAEQNVAVVVRELNTPPALGPMADQRIRAGDLLTFTATASDPDLPANTIAFSLGSGAPLGASIDSVTGAFRWTPSVAQSPSTNLITIIATDNGTPNQFSSRTVTVVVFVENRRPVLTVIPAQSIAEGSALTFTAAAADLDLPPQTLTFSLGTGAPIGAAIHPVTGVFTWTPSELQGPGTNVIVVRVTDSGAPPQSATQNVSITVSEVNTAPVLSLLSDQTIAQGDTLRLVAAATDADLPDNRLSFSLETGAPTGAAIDPASGAFAWTPTPAQTPSTNRVTIRVTDNGSPVLSDSKSFSVIVRTGINLPPTISTIADQATKENMPTGAIVFTINDPDTPLSNLKVLAASSNTNLVPDSNIVFDGIGTNRTATIRPAANENGTARITITVVENTGASASASFDLTVAPVPPAITRQPQSLDLVDGSQAAFSVSATGSLPLVYQWRFNGANVPGATNSTLTLPSVQEADEGVYTVEVRNSIGAVTSVEARLSADLPLGIRLQPASQSVLAGVDVTFSVAASGRAPLTYQWRFNGAAVPGANGSSFELRNVDATRTGEYIAIVSNASGSLASVAAKLEVKVPVAILTQPGSQIVPQGTNVTFGVEASGTPPLSYQWWLNGVDLPDRTNAVLTLTNVSPSDAGDYAVAVGNASGSIVSAQARLTVSVASAITRQPQSQTVLTGAGVTFNVSVSGTEPLAYQWRFNGINIPGSPNAPAFVFPNVQIGATGDYSVVVSNAAGVVTSDAAGLTVAAPVTFIQHPQSESVNAGESVALFFVAAGAGSSAAYQWRFNGVDIPGATRTQLTLTNVRADQAGRYTIVIRNAAGPVESNAATLVVSIPVTITLGPQSQTLTIGSSAVFAVSAAGTAPITYQWRLNGADLPGQRAAVLALSNVQKSNAGSYSVVVRNVVGVVTSASANLEVLAPPSIQTHPSSQNVPLGANVTFSVAASGDLPLSYQWQNNGVNIPGATSSTLGRSNLQVADAGNYSVVVENRGGAVTSDSANLTLILPPLNSGNSAQTAPAPIESLEGSFDGGSNEGGLVPLARKNAPPSPERWFSWRAPSSGIVTFSTSGSTFDTLMTIYRGTPPNLVLVESDDDRGGFLSSETRFNAVQGTTYLIKVDGFGGATGRIVLSFKLQVTDLRLPVIVSGPQSKSVSAGSSAVLSVAAQGTQLSYQWFANGVSIPNETRPDLELRNVQEKDVAQYTIRVTSGSGANQTSMESLPASLQLGAPNVAARDKFKQALAAAGAALQSLGVSSGSAKDALSSTASGFAGVHIFSTFGATREQGEPNHCDVVGGASQWLLYRAPQNGTLRVSTEGSGFDTLLAIYTGSGTEFETLKLERFDNNSGADGKTSVFQAPVTAGRLYFIAVDGVNGAAGRARLSYEFAQAPLISQQPGSLTQPDGGDVSFSVSTTNVLSGVMTNVAALSYQWLKDGVQLAGETKAGLILRGIKVENAGGYSVIVSNFAGAVTSVVARLTVIVPVKFTSSPQSQTAKAGDPVLLTGLASGTAPVAYQWKRNGLELPGETNSTLWIKSVRPVDAGSYQLGGRNAIGAAESLAAALSIIEAPVIAEAPQDQSVSSGSSVMFRVRVTGTDPLSYQWRFNGINIPDATGSSLVINNTQPLHIGAYAVVVSNPADAVVSPAARLAVRVPATLTSAPRSQVVNAGSSAVFSVTVSGSGLFAYQWRFNGVDIPGATNSTFVLAKAQAPNAGKYTVLVSTDTGIIESLPGTLTVNEVPVIVRQPANQTAIASGSVSFSVTAEGSSPLAYQWLKNGQPLAGATNAALTLDDLSSAAAGLYSVTVSNAAGSVNSTLAALDVRPVVSEMGFDSGVFQFQINVPEGKQARIQTSSDLMIWVDFTATPIPAGTSVVEDNEASGFSLRFYRILLE